MRSRATALVPPLVVTVVLALVAGCGGSRSGEADSSASDSQSAGSSAPDSGSPSPTPASPSQSASATPTEPKPTTLRGRLLGAAELPTFNPETRWRQAGTTDTEPRATFGTCQRFNITSIGAERVAIRRYLPTGDDMSNLASRAGELVAQFPDELTARRAFAVLKAWRARCADRLTRFRSSRVGAPQSVRVDGGTATWYLLTYGPLPKDPDARFLDAQGAVQVGSRIAMVSMLTVGQDYDYEPGHEPMVGALQRAARRLS